jgi:hypothetical protein
MIKRWQHLALIAIFRWFGKCIFKFDETWAPGIGEPPRVVTYYNEERDYNSAVRCQCELLDQQLVTERK